MVFLGSLLPSEENWSRFYALYLNDVQVFQGSTAGSSLGFQRHFCNGHVKWLCNVNRFTNYRNVEILNQSFLDFLTQRKQEIPYAFRMCEASFEAGFRSTAKYDRPQFPVEREAWSLAYNWTIKHFMPFMGGSEVIDAIDAIKSLNQQSSCGYPWNLKFKNKAAIFEAELRPWDGYWTDMGSNNTNSHVPIWCSTVKVELREIEKLYKYGAEYDSLRAFLGSPIEHVVCCARMYLVMNNLFYDSAGKSWSFVGGTKFSRGFHELLLKLRKHGKGFALDGKSYDASLIIALLIAVRDMRWEFFDSRFKTSENYRRHVLLYNSIIFSVIVLENGELFQKFTGGPSGSGNTIVDNTLALFLLFAYSFILCCWENKVEPTYSMFMECVEAVLNGDDNTFSVAEKIRAWFNARSIAKHWLSVGLRATASQDVWEPRSVEELDFLSHTFVEYDGVWLPCPNEQKVLCSLLYGSSINDVRWHLLRAYALRIDSWPNMHCRVVINDYIHWLLRHYEDDMVGSVMVSGNVIKMEDIRSVYKSDGEIKQMYIGSEGGPVTRLTYESDLFKISPTLVESLNIYPNSVYLHLFDKEPTIVENRFNQSLIMPPRTPEAKAKKKLRKKLAKERAKIDAIETGQARVNIFPGGKKGYKKAQNAAFAREYEAKNRLIKGSGDYKIFGYNIKSKYDSPWKALRGYVGGRMGDLGQMAGDAYAPGLGSVGRQLGNQLGPVISGDGDYVVNDLIHASGKVNGIPSFGKRVPPEGWERCAWEEPVCVLYATNNQCVVQTFIIQPSNPLLYPWGSRRAPMQRRWNPHKLYARIKSTSSDAPGTVGLGDVVMWSQSRNDEPVPNNILDALQMKSKCAAGPNDDMMLGIECDHKDRQYIEYYCSDGNTQSDSSRFDFGTLSVAIQVPGAPVNGVFPAIGRLYIGTDLDFAEPIPLDTWPLLAQGGVFKATSANCSAGLAFANVIVDNNFKNISTDAAGPNIYFPKVGTYAIILACITGTMPTAMSFGKGANIVDFNDLDNDAIPRISGISGTAACCIYLFNVVTAGMSNTDTNNALTPVLTTMSGCNMDILVFPLPFSTSLTLKNDLLERYIEKLLADRLRSFEVNLTRNNTPFIEEEPSPVYVTAKNVLKILPEAKSR